MAMRITLLCAGYGALLALLLACSESKRYYLPVKLLCSAAFVAAAVLCALWGGHTAALPEVLPAFLFCAAGDAALGGYYLTRRSPLILGGMALFFAGHCCFVGAIGRAQPFAWGELLLPAVTVPALLILLRRPGMEPGCLTPFAGLYCLAVSLLGAKALHLALAAPAPRTALLAAGALLFFASDFLLLFQYFYKPAKGSRPIHAANLLTYYGGVLLLALTLPG